MFKNVFGFSFYALDEKQVTDDLIWNFGKAEAILFSNEDLESSKWEKVWRNIENVCNKIGSENVSFHFPMDNCNYVNNQYIRERLVDALNKANDLGIKKIVIHPNMRYAIKEWQYINRSKMQDLLYKTILEITSSNKTDTILCLENMPPIGNKYDDGDSAVLFMEDLNKQINYTLDICHYFNVVKTMKEAQRKKEWREILAEIKKCDYFDFSNKLDNIKHFHFSAFEYIANPFMNQICIEGVLPNQSIIDEQIYAKAMKIIYSNAVENDKSIIFEISEENYYKRKQIFKMLAWAKEIIEK